VTDPVTVTIELPWTAPPLSLNDRGYTRGAAMAKAAKTREIRETMVALAVHAQLPQNVPHVTVQLHYQPRDSRRRDTDNLVATLKPLADALTPSRVRKGRTVPGYGMVPDDIPAFMAKPEPIIHDPVKGEGGRMWLEITYQPQEKAA
jgi:crossover junction endodeoxyribonuclease RusA